MSKSKKKTAKLGSGMQTLDARRLMAVDVALAPQPDVVSENALIWLANDQDPPENAEHANDGPVQSDMNAKSTDEPAPSIGPFYPYPQVPLGWRKVALEWDDGWWYLDFHDKH